LVEKPPRNSAGFCGGQSLSWAVEPRKEEKEEEEEEVTSYVFQPPGKVVRMKIQLCEILFKLGQNYKRQSSSKVGR
jgi:hypothetical protein